MGKKRKRSRWEQGWLLTSPHPNPRHKGEGWRGGRGEKVTVILSGSKKEITAGSEEEERALGGLKRRSDMSSGRIKGPKLPSSAVVHTQSVGVKLRRGQVAWVCIFLRPHSAAQVRACDREKLGFY